MQIKELSSYPVSVSFTAEDCLLLAEVCARWSECHVERAKDVAHVETMGAAFKAAGIASLAQECMGRVGRGDLARLLDEIHS